MQKIKISCPGTVANLVCGFDVLGMCLGAPCDIMEVKLLNEKKVVIKSTDNFNLPDDPQQNSAGAPLLEIINELNREIGFEVTIQKNIKPGSGLGSSAASAAGAVVCSKSIVGKYF